MARPAIGFKIVHRERLPGEKKAGLAKWDGKPKRCPKKGEYYLSGAIPMAYRAPNDLSTEYFIAIPLKGD